MKAIPMKKVKEPEPDNRTEEQKEADSKKAFEALQTMQLVKSMCRHDYY